MEVIIDGVHYVKAQYKKVGRFDGRDVFNCDCLFDKRKEWFNIIVDHIDLDKELFVSFDGRTIPIKHAVWELKKK